MDYGVNVIYALCLFAIWSQLNILRYAHVPPQSSLGNYHHFQIEDDGVLESNCLITNTGNRRPSLVHLLLRVVYVTINRG